MRGGGSAIWAHGCVWPDVTYPPFFARSVLKQCGVSRAITRETNHKISTKALARKLLV